MLFAHGSVRWLAADVVTTTYTVTSLGFQPKALRFYMLGLGSATNTSTETVNQKSSIGFCTSTSLRRSMGVVETDGLATMASAAGYRDDCVMLTVSAGTGAVTGLLDINSIDTDGFSLIVDDQATVDHDVFWEALGGDDFAVATIIDIVEPAATGNQDNSVPGFTADGVGQVVVFAGCQLTTAAPSGAATDSGFMVGCATGTGPAENIVAVGNEVNGSANANTDGYALDGECLAMVTIGGDAINARAQLTQWNTDGFRLNWIARGLTNRRYMALAIKTTVGLWRAGAYTISGNSAGATASVSGLPFSPIGLCLLGRMAVKDTAGTPTAQNRLGLGTGTSPSSRRSQGVLSEDGTASSEIDLTIQYAAALAFPSTTGTLQASYDLDAMTGDGFRIIVDTAGGVASEWQGYLAFGLGPLRVGSYGAISFRGGRR